jgi:hypothetical protein
MGTAIKMTLRAIVVLGSLTSVFAQVNISGAGNDGRNQLINSLLARDPHGPVALHERPVLENGILKFSVKDVSARVRIDICNLLGSAVVTLADSELLRGDYHINAAVRNLAFHLYFLNVKIGSNVSVIKMSLIENSSFHFSILPAGFA